MSGADGARRAVAYIRLTEGVELAEKSANAARVQRVAIESWAERERVDITSWEIDVGVDGATPIAKRPGLVRAYRAMVEQRADVLVAANADRFSHDEIVRWLIERAAAMQGATIQTADGSREHARPRADAPEENVAWTRGAIALARAHHGVTVRAQNRVALAERTAPVEEVGAGTQLAPVTETQVAKILRSAC